MRAAAAVAAAALAALYALASRAAAIGACGDDALHLILARSLRHGAFAIPDASGTPVNDPLPAFAALLALPSAWVQPHWAVLRGLGLVCAALALLLTWRLARRLAGPAAATAVLVLTALNPVLVERAGLILPDVPFLALSLLLFDRLDSAKTPKGTAWLAAGAALAALLRPEGLLLALALAAGIAALKGPRRAAAFLAGALTPLALWTVRNRLVTPAGSGYVTNMNAEMATLADPAAALRHAGALLAVMGGDGLLGLRGLPGAVQVLGGLAAAAAALWGAIARLKKKEEPLVFALAAYGALWAGQHLLWVPVAPRYVLPLAPVAWLLIAAAVEPFARRWKPLGPALVAAALILPLKADVGFAKRGALHPARLAPGTLAWIREKTPADARIESMEWAPVTLLTGRWGILAPLQAGSRDLWLAWTLAQKIDYVLVDRTLQPDGYFPAQARRLSASLEDWARSTPYLKEAFRDDAEGTVIFRVAHPRPLDLLEAQDDFDAAGRALAAGDKAGAIKKLKEAVAREPRLASAWAVLAGLSEDPKERLKLLEKAQELDPTSVMIREDLEAARSGWKVLKSAP